MLRQAAIDSCPVNCIHWTQREQLPALEYVMQNRMGRCNVGIMMSGCGSSRGDVWAATEAFLKERRERCACVHAESIVLSACPIVVGHIEPCMWMQKRLIAREPWVPNGLSPIY